MSRSPSLARWLRRRARRLLRLCYIAWLPCALVADCISWMISRFIDIPEPYISVLALTLSHASIFAAASVLRVGAAAAAATECYCTTLSFEDYRILSVDLHLDFQSLSACKAMYYSMTLGLLSSAVIFVRAVLIIGRIVICVPYLAVFVCFALAAGIL
eukprot:8117072-Pyramimonas_sp.AAC.1